MTLATPLVYGKPIDLKCEINLECTFSKNHTRLSLPYGLCAMGPEWEWKTNEIKNMQQVRTKLVSIEQHDPSCLKLKSQSSKNKLLETTREERSQLWIQSDRKSTFSLGNWPRMNMCVCFNDFTLLLDTGHYFHLPPICFSLFCLLTSTAHPLERNF